MKSTRSCCSVQSSDVADLILTGLPAPVSRRPGSASPAKLMARSVSVAADSKAKRNAPVSPCPSPLLCRGQGVRAWDLGWLRACRGSPSTSPALFWHRPRRSLLVVLCSMQNGK